VHRIFDLPVIVPGKKAAEAIFDDREHSAA
jgi:hypothetical protein